VLSVSQPPPNPAPNIYFICLNSGGFSKRQIPAEPASFLGTIGEL
jgi:hypothetical protein